MKPVIVTNRKGTSQLFQITLLDDDCGSYVDGRSTDWPHLAANLPRNGFDTEHGMVQARWVMGRSGEKPSAFRSDGLPHTLTFYTTVARSSQTAIISVFEDGKLIGTCQTALIDARIGPGLLGLRLTSPDELHPELCISNVMTMPTTFRKAYNGSSITDLIFTSHRSPPVDEYYKASCNSFRFWLDGYPSFAPHSEFKIRRASRVITLTDQALVFRNGSSEITTMLNIQTMEPTENPTSATHFHIYMISLKLGNLNTSGSPASVSLGAANLQIAPGAKPVWRTGSASADSKSLVLSMHEPVTVTMFQSGGQVTIFENGVFIMCSDAGFNAEQFKALAIRVMNCDIDLLAMRMWPGFRRMGTEEVQQARASESFEM